MFCEVLMRLKLILSVALLVSATHLFGQAHPAGYNGAVPLKLGIGFSNFNTDWGGRISGPNLWVNWSVRQVPGVLKGLGVAIEARDLNYARSAHISTLRFDTATAGAIYNFDQNRAIRPYGEFLMGLGSIDFPSANRRYTHDTRTIYVPGGGLECLIASRVRLRAGYEYQFWPDFFHHHALTPSGFTIGTSYDFGNPRTGQF
jgi:opacity protein-like surface antigen